MDYYNRIRNIDNHPVMSVNTYQYSLFSGDVVKALFGNKDYRAFQPDEAEGSFEATIEGITSDYSSIKTIWLDTKAYNYFGLSTSEGDDLNDDNTTLNNVDDCIPIVVGADYKDYVHIGQRLQIAERFSCAGRHDHADIFTVKDASDNVFLIIQKGIVTEILF